MSQDGEVMCFHPDHVLSPQHCAQEMEKRPWLSPSNNVVPASFNPNHCLSPSAIRIHLFQNRLTPEPTQPQPGIYNSTGSLIQKIPELNNFENGNCLTSGRLTAPCTPLKNRSPSSLCSSDSQIPLIAPVTGGQSSVVTFRFIEKASVRTLNGFPLVESRRESGLSKSLESGEAFHFGSNKQRSHGMNVQVQYSPQHKVTASLDPAVLDSRASFNVKTDKPSLAGTSSEDDQAPVILSSKQKHLDLNLKPEISASDPLLTENRFLLNTQPSLNGHNGNPFFLGANCLSTSLNNRMISNDISQLPRSPQSRKSQYQGSLWACSQESSAHAQRIAKAKWKFFYGSVDPSETGILPQKAPDPSPQLLEKSSLSVQPTPDWMVPEDNLCRVEVEIEMPPSGSTKPGNCETGIVCRTVKYSETDLDSVPLRCYRETNIDDILAEKEEADSAIDSSKDSGSNCSGTGIVGKGNAIPDGLFTQNVWEDDGKCLDNKVEGSQDDEMLEATEHHQERTISRNAPLFKSQTPFLFGHSQSKDGMDSFSKHFENILESHQAKGTSYTSLDSIDMLSSPAQTQSATFFTFDLPTLTPETQEEIQDNAKLNEQKFAPLALLEPDSGTSSSTDVPWDEQEDEPRPAWKRKLQSPCHAEGGLGIPLTSTISKHPLGQLVFISDSEMDLTEQRSPGSMETLSNGNSADLEAAKRLAKRLYNLDGFRKADVAHHLGKNNDFSKMVAGEYLKFFEFTGMTLDEALRSFLKELALMGETQERERVLAHFSQRYYECNPEAISSEDGAHTLACSLMLLNTDLHGHNIGKRMSCSEFIGNLEGLDEGKDFPRELLKHVRRPRRHLSPGRPPLPPSRRRSAFSCRPAFPAFRRATERASGVERLPGRPRSCCGGGKQKESVRGRSPLRFSATPSGSHCGLQPTSSAGRSREARSQQATSASAEMIGVNSINSSGSAGRLRTRSMCSVRYGRNCRGMETFCYGWPQRSRTLKPVLYTDLVVNRLQSRRKKKPAVYSSIKNEKLQWAMDEEELRKSLSELADPNSKSIKRISSNPFLDFSQDPSIALYKHGLLVRKSHAEPDCKKTPRGKRGWKTFHGILKGMILYLQKEEYKPGHTLAEEDLKNAISIHHSLATQASDYSKRPNVFYLRTADWRVFLFQAQNTEQMHSWITRINVVAAMFSAPPFPAAIGSQKKFTRPLLPSSTTRLSQEEQLKSHEAKHKAMASELVDHRSSLPEKKAKGKEYEEMKQKEEYLVFEKLRYSVYATVMRTKLKTGSEDLGRLEATLFETVGSTQNSLKDSLSSSPLTHEPAGPGPKMKLSSQQATKNQ